MTSYVFPKMFLCFRVRDEVRVEVRVSGNTFKNVFRLSVHSGKCTRFVLVCCFGDM